MTLFYLERILTVTNHGLQHHAAGCVAEDWVLWVFCWEMSLVSAWSSWPGAWHSLSRSCLHCAACALTLYSATLYTVHCTLYTVQVTMIHPCTCTLPSSVQTLTCVVMYIYLLFYIWIVLDFWIVSWRHSMAYSGFFRFIHCKAINIKFLYMSILPSWIARKVYTK